MNQSELEKAIKDAFPNALLLNVKHDETLPASDGSALFTGVLADASFNDKSESERFYNFIRSLNDQLNGAELPKIRLLLLSEVDYRRLMGLVA